ncbi:MAG: DUF4351 domain-containing protein [Thermotogota bacterium]|nr:DUF4351 domain-containing protein [Thermotogota bacterium]
MEENEELKISYKNYDMVIKDALTLFENKTLDFLGLDLPKIISVEDSELYKTETKNNFIDLIFMLEDGTLLHIEEEAHVSSKDLLRFAQTDLMIYGKKHTKIHTVVITKTKESMSKINAGSLNYEVTILNLANGSWETDYKRLKTQVERGQEINELELIFLPLKKLDEENEIYVDQSLALAKKLKTSKEMKTKIISMMVVLMDKYLTKEKILNIWEELNMLNIMKVAEEKGYERGRESTKELIWKMILKKFPDIQYKYYEKVKALKADKLDAVSLALLDMKDSKELDLYL